MSVGVLNIVSKNFIAKHNLHQLSLRAPQMRGVAISGYTAKTLTNFLRQSIFNTINQRSFALRRAQDDRKKQRLPRRSPLLSPRNDFLEKGALQRAFLIYKIYKNN